MAARWFHCLRTGLLASSGYSVYHALIFHTLRTSTECCSAGRCAFFALNAIGSRFGCLHPLTSFRLCSSLCVPILIYGSELWSGSEITMFDKVHRKILITIQGTPLRCPCKALHSGWSQYYISQTVQVLTVIFARNSFLFPRL